MSSIHDTASGSATADARSTLPNLANRLKVFSIDPTSLNRQGHDVGMQYRTGIYYTDENDVTIVNKVLLEQQRRYSEEIVVEVLPLENFYSAEEYHQDYLDKNPNGYCHLPLELFEFAKQFNR